jgi:hypothetical protein
MENMNHNQSASEILTLIHCQDFLMTPSWGEFLFISKSREGVIDLYEHLLDAGFHSLAQPHEVIQGIFIAKLCDPSGRHLLLRADC